MGPCMHTIADIGINFTYTPCSRGRVGCADHNSAGPSDTYEVMLEEREVANCVDSIITQYYYFIIVM